MLMSQPPRLFQNNKPFLLNSLEIRVVGMTDLIIGKLLLLLIKGQNFKVDGGWLLANKSLLFKKKPPYNYYLSVVNKILLMH